jgi:hypothetical protein
MTELGGISMDNYLEYLAKLQSKMDFSKNVNDEKVALYFDMKNVNQRVSNLYLVILVSLELLLHVIGVTTDIVHRNIIANVMLLVFLFFGIVVLKYAWDARFYKNLACCERDKIYFANYDIVKNEILNDGEEQIRQLILWNEMCDLTIANQKRYKELLRIVRAVCREYKEIYK